MGIFSGWCRGDVVGKGRVEPGEDLRRFENKGKCPRAPKKGSKKLSKCRILKMQRFSKLLGDAVVIGMFLEGKCNRAHYEVCSEDADAEVSLHGPGRVV